MTPRTVAWARTTSAARVCPGAIMRSDDPSPQSEKSSLPETFAEPHVLQPTEEEPFGPIPNGLLPLEERAIVVRLSAPAPRPPHPGLLAAVGWCIAFLAVTYGVLFVVFLGAVIVQAILSGNAKAYLDALGNSSSAVPGPVA